MKKARVLGEVGRTVHGPVQVIDNSRHPLPMRRPTAWGLLLAASVVLLGVDAVLVETGAVGSTDRWLWNLYASSLGPASFRIVESFTFVGLVRDSSLALEVGVVLLTVAIGAVLASRGQPLTAVALGVAVVGAASISEFLKRVVERAGPSLNRWTPLGHTFPSGTAATAVALFGFLAWLVFRRLGEGR